jgi:hypothetical protein
VRAGAGITEELLALHLLEGIGLEVKVWLDSRDTGVPDKQGVSCESVQGLRSAEGVEA